ncbi:MAG: hypothetical protein KC619_19360 [Myxococcales bacterium]|nr:hypothetical protein [Myxococcales bacterium]
MGYYLRFITSDDAELGLETIEAALKSVDPKYEIRLGGNAQGSAGDLLFDGDLYGEIEINGAGEELFNEEMGELAESAEDGDGDTRRVLDLLASAKQEVVVRVLWQGRQSEETLAKIDPLWEWLFVHYQGLLQADAEGWYDDDGVVLAVD